MGGPQRRESWSLRRQGCTLPLGHDTHPANLRVTITASEPWANHNQKYYPGDQATGSEQEPLDAAVREVARAELSATRGGRVRPHRVAHRGS